MITSEGVEQPEGNIADVQGIYLGICEVLWDLSIQKDKILVANQAYIVVAGQRDKKTGVVDVALWSDSTIRCVKASVVPVVIGALWAVPLKLGDWFQQI